VLTDPEVEDIRAGKTVSKQNKILLSCLKHKSPKQRQHFLVALDSTGQQHVANWIEQSTSELIMMNSIFTDGIVHRISSWL